MTILGRHRVIQGDCVEVMRGMEPESVDAIVTDPPYDLTNRTPDVKRCESCGRILGGADGKPDSCPRCGGVLSNQRSTQGRGFMGKTWDGTGIAFRPEIWEEALRIAKPGAYLLAAGSPRTYHRLACAIEDAGWVLIDCIQHLHGQGFPKGKGQLKPAYEPWTLARKPAPRVLPLRIDACRIVSNARPVMVRTSTIVKANAMSGESTGATPNGEMTTLGRWPANIILSESAAQGLDEMSGTGSVGYRKNPSKPDASDSITYGMSGTRGERGYMDSGGASRFFYTPKASRSERGEGNIHPTVKPLALMRWLCKLVVPPGGICLDPFGGSGTTLLACEQEGFASILIERETEYVDIITRRYEQMTKQPALPEVG